MIHNTHPRGVVLWGDVTHKPCADDRTSAILFHFMKERTHSCEIFMMRKAPCSRKSFAILIYHEACSEKEVVNVGTMSTVSTNSFGPKFLKHVPLKRTLCYQHKVLLK